ncbi:glycosyltransferase [Mucilaginibacter sp. CAU 1740]|uniref:glycosyltransferase n=1 Tax=Mucilaginibacter sp. CAU 1740 TaxID=3140365 RepID=UPI00325ABB37
MRLSVIIPTYNPDKKRLEQTLNSLKSQSSGMHEWELIIIDNNSSNNFQNQVDLSWHPAAKIITETKQGLTYARLKGFNESAGEIIVMVDDDNILNSDYLEQVISIFDQNSQLAALGGKSLPLFEAAPPVWLHEFYGNLALRDLGNDIIISGWVNQYPHAAPIGAGMAMRREALDTYIVKITTSKSTISDRSGTSLSSGGDNDLVLEILKAGWQVAYFPQLTLQHIIPAQRMEVAYLARLVHDTNKSWVQLLESHGINPWKRISTSGVLPRKIKAWFTYKAWKSKPDHIKWQGACGLFEGLASLPQN